MSLGNKRAANKIVTSKSKTGRRTTPKPTRQLKPLPQGIGDRQLCCGELGMCCCSGEWCNESPELAEYLWCVDSDTCGAAVGVDAIYCEPWCDNTTDMYFRCDTNFGECYEGGDEWLNNYDGCNEACVEDEPDSCIAIGEELELMMSDPSYQLDCVIRANPSECFQLIADAIQCKFDELTSDLDFQQLLQEYAEDPNEDGIWDCDTYWGGETHYVNQSCMSSDTCNSGCACSGGLCVPNFEGISTEDCQTLIDNSICVMRMVDWEDDRLTAAGIYNVTAGPIKIETSVQPAMLTAAFGGISTFSVRVKVSIFNVHLHAKFQFYDANILTYYVDLGNLCSHGQRPGTCTADNQTAYIFDFEFYPSLDGPSQQAKKQCVVDCLTTAAGDVEVVDEWNLCMSTFKTDWEDCAHSFILTGFTSAAACIAAATTTLSNCLKDVMQAVDFNLFKECLKTCPTDLMVDTILNLIYNDFDRNCSVSQFSFVYLDDVCCDEQHWPGSANFDGTGSPSECYDWCLDVIGGGSPNEFCDYWTPYYPYGCFAGNNWHAPCIGDAQQYGDTGWPFPDVYGGEELGCRCQCTEPTCTGWINFQGCENCQHPYLDRTDLDHVCIGPDCGPGAGDSWCGCRCKDDTQGVDMPNDSCYGLYIDGTYRPWASWFSYRGIGDYAGVRSLVHDILKKNFVGPSFNINDSLDGFLECGKACISELDDCIHVCWNFDSGFIECLEDVCDTTSECQSDAEEACSGVGNYFTIPCIIAHLYNNCPIPDINCPQECSDEHLQFTTEECDYCIDDFDVCTQECISGSEERSNRSSPFIYIQRLIEKVSENFLGSGFDIGNPLASSCNIGDMNGDGGWNVLDIVTLANCVLAGNCAELEFGCAGDLNGDGGYNVLDIVTLANCVLAGNCGGNHINRHPEWDEDKWRYYPPEGISKLDHTKIIQKIVNVGHNLGISIFDASDHKGFRFINTANFENDDRYLNDIKSILDNEVPPHIISGGRIKPTQNE